MSSEKIIDISPSIDSDLPVWPGDVPYSRRVSLSFDRGDNLNLSAIHTTVHLGAHADAPSHYAEDGDDIGSRSLRFYYGPCQVLAVSGAPGARIVPDDLSEAIRAPRVLFKTGSFSSTGGFNRGFAGLSAGLIAFLREKEVILVGVDTPSVDLFDDKVLESHRAAHRADMALLEGLVLDHVSPGLYTLCALPLPLVGADASPVRAVLIR